MVSRSWRKGVDTRPFCQLVIRANLLPFQAGGCWRSLSIRSRTMASFCMSTGGGQRNARVPEAVAARLAGQGGFLSRARALRRARSEEHTSELHSHSFTPYAVFCL